MSIEKKITEQFQKVWSGCPDRRDSFHLADKLKLHFERDIDAIMPPIIALFDGMGLPLPTRDSMMLATEGAMVFLDDYGLAIRIEREKGWTGTHIDDHPLMLNTLLRRNLTAGIVLEICPGVRTTQDVHLRDDFAMVCRRQGILFSDPQPANMGLLPGSDQIVILDRMAARHMDGFTGVLKRVLARTRQSRQKEMYAVLKKAADQAWPKRQAFPLTQGLQHFLRLAAEAKQAGILVAGWMKEDDNKPFFVSGKPDMATAAGRAYVQQIKKRQAVVHAP